MHDVSILSEKSALSLGMRLAALREEKGIPLEQAARQTRILVQRLREMEVDDLSHFVHPSYARMFLMDYARYLGLPLEEVLPQLPASGTCGTEGYQYLQSEGPLPVRRLRPIRRLRRMSPALSVCAAGVLGLLLIAGGIKVTNIVRDIHRLDLGKVTKSSDQAVLTADPVSAAPSQVAPEPPAVEAAPASPFESSMNMLSAPAPDAPLSLFVGSAIDHGKAVQ